MSRMTRPSGTGQGGFGLLETLAGLVVFVLLLGVGTRAYRNVVHNHSEASQVKAITDAVATTAERLSGFTMAVLAGPGSPHLTWSEPAEIGSGTYHYRYRIVPRPSVGGRPDTTVVGLEVEAGTVKGGVFIPTRAFATLIPPNLSAKGALGAVSTQAERDAEKDFHDRNSARIADLTVRVLSENQDVLNSFKCYDKEECCTFMRKFFLDPSLAPDDGLEEKCHYRCALGGDVSRAEWRQDCGFDLCTLAPWKTRESCCAAIADGSCQPGSVCARVCVECVGEDGSTCSGGPTCDAGLWNDLFDCKNESFCDGTPLPDGLVPGWGNVKLLCRTEACAAVPAECDWRPKACCYDYWGVLNSGGTPKPELAICATISKPEECCQIDSRKIGYYTLNCGTDGRIVSIQTDIDKQWYCGQNGPGWNGLCDFAKGCPSNVGPPEAPDGGCRNWTGPALTSPWIDPRTGKPWAPPPGWAPPPSGPSSGPKTTLPPSLPRDGGGGFDRSGSKRDGDGGERGGGRE